MDATHEARGLVDDGVWRRGSAFRPLDRVVRARAASGRRQSRTHHGTRARDVSPDSSSRRGVLFNLLNRILEGQGGFLRRRGLIRRHIVRRRRSETRQLLKSLSNVEYFRSLPAEEAIRLMPDVETAVRC